MANGPESKGLAASFTLGQNTANRIVITVCAGLLAGSATLPASAQPGWYAAHRVHGHSRLSPPRFDLSADFFEASSRRARELGAPVLVRHVKTGDESVDWWRKPAKLEQGAPAQTLLQSMFSQHAMPHIAYYWHLANAGYAKQHPDEVCQLRTGRPAEHRRGLYLDITGPYKRHVLNDLLEVRAAGAAGFYFDFRHLPADGCYGTSLEQAFRERYPDVGRGTRRLRSDLRWWQFRAARMADTFEYWISGVKSRFPDTVFIVSGTAIPGMSSVEMSTQLVARSAAKTEFRNALRKQFNGRVFETNRALLEPGRSLRIAAGLAIMRDASGGIPPHVWSPGFPDTRHALGFARAVVGLGAIANADIGDELLGSDRATSAKRTSPESLREMFDFGRAASQVLGQARPMQWAALHYSEAARDEHWPDERAQWEQVLWPFLGAYQALMRAGVPFTVVNDQQLASGQLGGAAILILPSGAPVTAEQRTSVADFERSDAHQVVQLGSVRGWSDPGKNNAALKAAGQLLQPLLADAPVWVDAGSDSALVTIFNTEDAEHIVAIGQDFSWVRDQLPRQKDHGDSLPNPPKPLAKPSFIYVKHAAVGERGLKAVEALSGRQLEVVNKADHSIVKLDRVDGLALVVLSDAG